MCALRAKPGKLTLLASFHLADSDLIATSKISLQKATFFKTNNICGSFSFWKDLPSWWPSQSVEQRCLALVGYLQFVLLLLLFLIGWYFDRNTQLWKRWPCHWISVACPFANTHFLTHYIGFALHCPQSHYAPFYYELSLCGGLTQFAMWRTMFTISIVLQITKVTYRCFYNVWCVIQQKDQKESEPVIDGRMFLLCLLSVSTQHRVPGTGTILHLVALSCHYITFSRQTIFTFFCHYWWHINFPLLPN